MLNIFLFLGIAFLLTFLIGRVLEKAKVPWIFGALLLGAALSIYNPFQEITFSETFSFLAKLGMYFLLFIIGYEIDLKSFKKNSKFILKATFFVILFESLFGSLIIHYLFNIKWAISIIVALSFATVGEAILIPILDKFKIANTKIGQSIIGIGTFDDLIEIIILLFVTFLISSSITYGTQMNFVLILTLLFGLFSMTFILTKLKKQSQKFKVNSIEMLFLLTLFIFFLFLGIGQYADSIPIAALLAGIAIKTFVPNERLETIENEIKTMCYGFFAPIFFIWVGVKMDMHYLLSAPLLILVILFVSSFAKILASYVVGKKELGAKKSILLGVGLSVRFSTSIIIIKILFENSLINSNLYSVLIASSIIFNFIVPFLFSRLLIKWNIHNRT